MSKLTLSQLKSIKAGKTLNARFKNIQQLKFDKSNITELLKSSEADGASELDLTTKALLLRSVNGSFEESFEIAAFSAKAAPKTRRSIVKNFVKNKQSVVLVHNIAQMKRADATNIMKDFFAEGGKMDEIAEWLMAAGNILKTGAVPGDTDGLFGDAWNWVKKTGKKVADAVVGAINTVADAIKAAGKNLADAIKQIINWSQDKVNDFVEAVIRAGKTVGEILNEVKNKATSVFNKFMRAVYEAGKSALEIMTWAITHPEQTLIKVLNFAETLVGSFTSLLFDIARMTVTSIGKAVRALLKAGKKLADFIVRLGRMSYNFAKQLVVELKKAGQTLKNIIAAAINQTRQVIRIILDALISLRESVLNIFKEIASRTITVIQNFIGALKDLGTTLLSMLDHIAKLALAQAKKIMTALRKIFTVLKDILEAIGRKAESVIKTLMAALIGTLIHMTEVLKTILVDVRTAFRKGLVKGLLAIGKSILTLMKEAVKINASVVAVLFAIILDITGNTRNLNAKEMAEARKVFGTSIDLNAVKLTDASLPADFITWLNGNRPFTTMYVINFNSKTKLSMETLIHELTHVWQAENSGGVYMLEALHSQFFGRGYNLNEKDIQKANGDLLKLEREQQAVLVEEYWKAKFNGQTIRLDLKLIEPLAKQVFKSNVIFKPIDLKRLRFDTQFVRL